MPERSRRFNLVWYYPDGFGEPGSLDLPSRERKGETEMRHRVKRIGGNGAIARRRAKRDLIGTPHRELPLPTGAGRGLVGRVPTSDRYYRYGSPRGKVGPEGDPGARPPDALGATGGRCEARTHAESPDASLGVPRVVVNGRRMPTGGMSNDQVVECAGAGTAAGSARSPVAAARSSSWRASQPSASSSSSKRRANLASAARCGCGIVSA